MSVHEKLDRRDPRYLKFVFGRAQYSPIETIVKELDDPGIDSPQELYRRLQRDGYPVCPICGEAPAQQGHCQEAAPKRQARRGGGEAQELAPVEEAIPLFMQALESLAEMVEALRGNRKEHLQDERFVAKNERPVGGTLLRGPMSDEQWKNLCEGAGLDSSSDRLELSDSRLVEPLGATQRPAEPLTPLIGAYILAGLPLRPLLERLHLAPENVNEAELVRHIEGEEKGTVGKTGKTTSQQTPGLKTKAAQVAQLVQGKPLRRGPSTGELSPEEMNIVWYRQQRDREGAPDAQIYRELKDSRGVTKNNYERLKKFRLDGP